MKVEIFIQQNGVVQFRTILRYCCTVVVQFRTILSSAYDVTITLRCVWICTTLSRTEIVL